ncbi:HAD hydrolase-like protein [Paeniglutamicibacter sp. NPDC012692]|uniref:HAD hydrolase-like protein n=1 Tax=Paeniglutamicibacter sp. NPDC012692 TaxID=3364388 RepID=UPI0036948571
MIIAPSAVLLDLDGTLVDPAGAITSGIRHALKQADVPDPGEEKLRTLIGPPLVLGLAEIDGVEPHMIDDLIAVYRAEYAATGMADSRPYPGIREVLAALREAGIDLYVATAKPTKIARQLLDIQGLTGAVDGIFGNDDEANGNSASKRHIVAAVLEAHGLAAEHCIMVGDRRYDIEAANDHNMASIGAGWGFAPPGELEASGAGAHAKDPAELAGLLLGNAAEETIRTQLTNKNNEGARA